MNAIKNEANTPSRLDETPPTAPPPKKRKVPPGSRSVAHMTPDQRDKKRANDREAQRAIRERTRQQIETMRQQIDELRSTDAHRELEAERQRRRTAEAVVEGLRRQLGGVASVLSEMAGAYSSGPNTGLSAGPPSTSLGVNTTTTTTAALPLYSAPSSIASPGSPASHMASDVTPRTSNVSGSHEARPHDIVASIQLKQVGRQWHDMGHSLEGLTTPQNQHPQSPYPPPQYNQSPHHTMSPYPHQYNQPYPHPDRSRLTVNFLIDDACRAKIPIIHDGEDGPQDSGAYSHLGMHSHPPSQSQDIHARYPRTLPPLSSITHTPTYTPTDTSPSHSTPILNSAPSCPLDHILLGFLAERQRTFATTGAPISRITGPRHPSVHSLLSPVAASHAHPLSRVLVDILVAFPDLSGLPERVAIMYIMFCLLRWQIDPSPENFAGIPEIMLPGPLQLSVPHPAWIDHLPFPKMREKLIELGMALTPRNSFTPTSTTPTAFTPTSTTPTAFAPANSTTQTFIEKYALEDFFIPFTQTMSVNWPYPDTHALLQSPHSTDDIVINPVFVAHLRNLDNWTVGAQFRDLMPALEGTFNLK